HAVAATRPPPLKRCRRSMVCAARKRPGPPRAGRPRAAGHEFTSIRTIVLSRTSPPGWAARSVADRAQGALDPPVGHEPGEGDGGIDAERDLRPAAGEPDGEQVEEGRELALPVAADGAAEQRIPALRADDESLQNPVCNRGHEEDDTVRANRNRGEVTRVHPGHRGGKEREPEEQ